MHTQKKKNGIAPFGFVAAADAVMGNRDEDEARGVEGALSVKEDTNSLSS